MNNPKENAKKALQQGYAHISNHKASYEIKHFSYLYIAVTIGEAIVSALFGISEAIDNHARNKSYHEYLKEDNDG